MNIGSLVYISTDDPDGVCLNCWAKGKECSEHSSPKPLGCPEDVLIALFYSYDFCYYAVAILECLH